MTQIMIKHLASPRYDKSLKDEHYRIVHLSFTCNGSVINLGDIFDQCINIYEQVTTVYLADYYHLMNIHRLKEFLAQEALLLWSMLLLQVV